MNPNIKQKSSKRKTNIAGQKNIPGQHYSKITSFKLVCTGKQAKSYSILLIHLWSSQNVIFDTIYQNALDTNFHDIDIGDLHGFLNFV